MGFGSRLPAGRPDQPPLSMRAGTFYIFFNSLLSAILFAVIIPIYSSGKTISSTSNFSNIRLCSESPAFAITYPIPASFNAKHVIILTDISSPVPTTPMSKSEIGIPLKCVYTCYIHTN